MTSVLNIKYGDVTDESITARLTLETVNQLGLDVLPQSTPAALSGLDPCTSPSDCRTFAYHRRGTR